MDLPTEEQCLQYFEEFKVPRNIKSHCLNVQRVAVFLANKLNQTGENIDVGFVGRLSLLHDLFKVVDIKSPGVNKFHNHVWEEDELEMRKTLKEKYLDMDEGEIAHEFFKNNFIEFANSLKNFSGLDVEKSWEEKLTFYADARIFQSGVVTLMERFEYLHNAYPERIERFLVSGKELNQIETDIFNKLGFPAKELTERIENG